MRRSLLQNERHFCGRLMFYWVMLAKEGVILDFFVRNDLNWKTKFSCRASICFWYKNGGVFLEKIGIIFKMAWECLLLKMQRGIP